MDSRQRTYRATIFGAIALGWGLLGWLSTATAFVQQPGLLLVGGGLILLVLSGAAIRYWILMRSPRVWTRFLRMKHAPATGSAAIRAVRSVWAGIVATALDYPRATEQAYASLLWRGAADSETSPQGEARSIPLLLPIRALEAAKRYANWAFVIRVHTSGITVSTEGNGEPLKTLRIELNKSDLGVYNNTGKRFLRRAYGTESGRASAEGAAAWNALSDFGAEADVTVAKGVPLRWASGGVLPLVEWRGDRWVALFYRDISPIGWNIANGSAENLQEHADVGVLAHREFCEELMVCSSDPYGGIAVVARPFAFSAQGGDRVQLSTAKSREHLEVHRKLRETHDGVVISMAPTSSAVKVRDIDTPWACEVHGARGTKRIEDVIPSVNPHELGIELTQILEFKLRDTEVLLDGEILEAQDALARRPVALFRVSALREAFTSTGLGDLPSSTADPTTGDIKVLPVLAPGDVYMFTADIRQRKIRLEHPDTPEGERRLIRNWLAAYEDKLTEQQPTEPTGDAVQASLNHELVRQLCPTTWKTLQLAFDRALL